MSRWSPQTPEQPGNAVLTDALLRAADTYIAARRQRQQDTDAASERSYRDFQRQDAAVASGRYTTERPSGIASRVGTPIPISVGAPHGAQVATVGSDIGPSFPQPAAGPAQPVDYGTSLEQAAPGPRLVRRPGELSPEIGGFAPRAIFAAPTPEKKMAALDAARPQARVATNLPAILTGRPEAAAAPEQAQPVTSIGGVSLYRDPTYRTPQQTAEADRQARVSAARAMGWDDGEANAAGLYGVQAFDTLVRAHQPKVTKPNGWELGGHQYDNYSDYVAALHQTDPNRFRAPQGSQPHLINGVPAEQYTAAYTIARQAQGAVQMAVRGVKRSDFYGKDAGARYAKAQQDAAESAAQLAGYGSLSDLQADLKQFGIGARGLPRPAAQGSSTDAATAGADAIMARQQERLAQFYRDYRAKNPGASRKDADDAARGAGFVF